MIQVKYPEIRKELEEHLRALAYLRPVDEMEHSRGTAHLRGEAWASKVSTYLKTTRYSLGRSLTGPEGMHRLWSDYTELYDSLVARMTMPKLTVSVTPPDTELPFVSSIHFLSSSGHVRGATYAP